MNEKDSKSAQDLYRQANKYYEKGEFEKSIALYSLAIELDPENPKYVYHRGLAKACLNMYDDAIEDFRKTLELDVNHAEAHYLIGLSFEYKDMIDEAIIEHQKALKLNPHLTDAQTRLDRIEEKRRQGSSRPLSKASVSKDSQNEHSATLERVKDLGNSGEYPEALELLDEKLKMDPDDFRLLLTRRMMMAKAQVASELEAVLGLDDVKDTFDKIMTALRNSSHPLYQARIARSFKGIILHGPPGCGKTMITISQAKEAGIELIEIVLSEILNMWSGESEKRLTLAFAAAKENAKKGKTTILFIDELDALGLARSVTTEPGESSWSRDLRSTFRRLFNEVQDIPNLLIIGATNSIWAVDSALRRPGRLGAWIIYVPAPDAKTREHMFRLFSDGTPSTKRLDFKKLARKTKWFSGDDIRSICREVHLEISRDIVKHKRHRAVAKTKDYEKYIRQKFPQARSWVAEVAKAVAEGKIRHSEIGKRLKADIEAFESEENDQKNRNETEQKEHEADHTRTKTRRRKFQYIS